MHETRHRLCIPGSLLCHDNIALTLQGVVPSLVTHPPYISRCVRVLGLALYLQIENNLPMVAT
jgi:hypothetical protein